MKFFLKRLLLLLVVTYTLQFLLFTGGKSLFDKKSQFRFSRFFRSPRHANFILGNSRAVNSVNEKYANAVLHADVMNLGFNGMPYQQIKVFTDEVNRQNTNATLFVEITALVTDQEDDSYAFYISNSPLLKEQYRNSVFNYLQLLRFDNEIMLRNLYYLRKSDNDWVNRYTISQALINDIRSDTSRITLFPQPEILFQRMKEIKKSCEAHQNKVVFFMAPYYPDYLKHLQDYRSITDSLAAQSALFRFYDLNQLTLPANGFADRVHTNMEGAAILTDYLMKLSAGNH